MKIVEKKKEYRLHNRRQLTNTDLVEYDEQMRVVGKLKNERTGEAKPIALPWRTVAYRITKDY